MEISKTNILSSFINDGDKEPCWDGNIYIHENAKHTKKNIKRIPTQVKGRAATAKSVKESIKYGVSYDDLNAYIDGLEEQYSLLYILIKKRERYYKSIIQFSCQLK